MLLPVQVVVPRALLYVNDLVVLLAPATSDFNCLAEILELFVGASGLVTNQEKCLITPIHCDDDAIVAVQ